MEFHFFGHGKSWKVMEFEVPKRVWTLYYQAQEGCRDEWVGGCVCICVIIVLAYIIVNPKNNVRYASTCVSFFPGNLTHSVMGDTHHVMPQTTIGYIGW